MSKIKHYHHHFHFSYQTTIKRHLASIVGVTITVAILIFLIIHFANPNNTFNINQISWTDIFLASINTLTRLFVAYIFSLVFSIPLALLITSTPRVEKILLPIFDIIQSIPVLAFFPIVVVFFAINHAFELAAIFILFMSMLWNLVFSMVGGLKAIPEDVKSASVVFKVHGIKKLFYITLPAIFPFITTGSLLAWGQGWSIIIVAEVLHTYIPNGMVSQDLLGLGSLLVDSFAQGKNSVFLATLVIMILVISLLNFVVWQKLLHFTERFRFD
ncbi:MAG: ABC transporter permease subunit [Patescibacteria group bacterium]|jgi:NitT/TauT family transport system permease protein